MRSYLVIGFVPDDNPKVTGLPEPEWGVHTPLRQDGYYGLESASQTARLWRANLVHPLERVSVVEVVSEISDTEVDNGL